jgi:rubrerythrin
LHGAKYGQIVNRVSEEAGAGTRLEPAADGFVAFLEAGVPVAGEFRCSECGYGVTVHRELPRCPMCGGAAWERTPAKREVLRTSRF